MGLAEGVSDVKKMQDAKVTFFMSTFNEEDRLGLLINEIKKLKLNSEFVVSDLGSFDGTIQIAEELGAHVFKQAKTNLAITYLESLKNSFKLISSDTDILVIINPNDRFPASKIPQLISPIFDGKADVVFGSTYLSRSTGSKILTIFLRLISRFYRRVGFTDPFTTLRAYSSKALKIYKLEKDIKISELDEKIFKSNLILQEVSVKRRPMHRRSNFTFMYALRILKEILMN